MYDENITINQLLAIKRFCDYASSINSDEERVTPKDLTIEARPHNYDENSQFFDLTVLYLTPDIIVLKDIDCYGNGRQVYGNIEWVAKG